MRLPILAFALALVVAPPLAGQREPARPAVPRSADPNDWEAYQALGEQWFTRSPQRAADAFYWASRLDPSRAEPLAGRWAAFFAQNQPLWISYLEEDRHVVRRADVLRNDSLLTRAYQRNPFVHMGLEAMLYDRLGGRLRWDGAVYAFLEYGRGNFREAADRFGRLARAYPSSASGFGHWRAVSLVGAGEPDSAAAEIGRLLDRLRGEDEDGLVRQYRSKAMYEYSLGRILEVRGRSGGAREAYARALVEDLSLVPAHAALGRMALRAGRAEEAETHLAQAAELAPDDALVRLEHGAALLAAGRGAEAAAWLRRAVELEPHWALARLRLAEALERAGDDAGAAAAYREYLPRAPRRDAAEIARVRARLAALGGS